MENKLKFNNIRKILLSPSNQSSLNGNKNDLETYS